MIAVLFVMILAGVQIIIKSGFHVLADNNLAPKKVNWFCSAYSLASDVFGSTTPTSEK